MANNEHINKVVKSTGETLIDLTNDTVTAETLLKDVTAHDRSGAPIVGEAVIPTVNDGTLTIQQNGTTKATFTANQAGNVTADITVPTTPADIGAAPLTSSSTIDFVGEGISLKKPGETNASFTVRTQTVSGVRENWLDVDAPNSSGARGVFIRAGNTATTIGVVCQNTETLEDYGVHFKFDSDIFYGGVLKSSPPTHDDNHFKFNLDCAGDSIGRAANSGAALSGSTLDLWYETIRFNGKVMDMFAHSGQSHNAICRKKYLGDTFTAAQKAAIADGSFDDLFVGDYWHINNIHWRIAHLNYYLNTGDTATTTPHLVMVPDEWLANSYMNATNITTGAYVGSYMYTTTLLQDGTEASDSVFGKIKAAFGEENLLSIRQLFANAVDSNGNVTGWAMYSTRCFLMNQAMVYGQKAWSNGNNDGYNVGIDATQLALFAHDTSAINRRYTYWLRDVLGSTLFTYVNLWGVPLRDIASYPLGVRPVFLLKGA